MQFTKEAEIWETEEDRQLPLNKLKEKYIEYARSHFIKKPHLIVVNQTTNYCNPVIG